MNRRNALKMFTGGGAGLAATMVAASTPLQAAQTAIRRGLPPLKITNVKTILGEFSDPKLPAADVDVAFLHDVIHHIQDRPAYLKSVLKYLKPGGRIVVIDYNPANSPHSGDVSLQVSKEQAGAWLSSIGFSPVREVPLAADKWFVIYARR